jgi:hypothetical protein
MQYFSWRSRILASNAARPQLEIIAFISADKSDPRKSSSSTTSSKGSSAKTMALRRPPIRVLSSPSNDLRSFWLWGVRMGKLSLLPFADELRDVAGQPAGVGFEEPLTFGLGHSLANALRLG